MTLSFRPHHFLCTLGFQGKGYSPRFVENYATIAKALKNDENTLIEVVSVRDSICGACPHQRADGCEKEEKIQQLDARHSKILALKPGDVLNWREAKERFKRHMTLAAFHQACRGCPWKPLGLCERALRELRGGERREAKATP
jgi:hypothetical protein